MRFRCVCCVNPVFLWQPPQFLAACLIKRHLRVTVCGRHRQRHSMHPFWTHWSTQVAKRHIRQHQSVQRHAGFPSALVAFSRRFCRSSCGFQLWNGRFSVCQRSICFTQARTIFLASARAFTPQRVGLLAHLSPPLNCARNPLPFISIQPLAASRLLHDNKRQHKHTY